eukprot:scaffold34627_cov159-Amphora_coffeaeformis.AAC.9
MEALTEEWWEVVARFSKEDGQAKKVKCGIFSRPSKWTKHVELEREILRHDPRFGRLPTRYAN